MKPPTRARYKASPEKESNPYHARDGQEFIGAELRLGSLDHHSGMKHKRL